MPNVTITLDDDLSDWATAEAVRRGQSLSDYVAEVIRPKRVPDLAESLAILNEFFEGPGWPGIAEDWPRRDDIYDRPTATPPLSKT